MKVPSTLLDSVKVVDLSFFNCVASDANECPGKNFVNKKERAVLIQDVDKEEGGGNFDGRN